MVDAPAAPVPEPVPIDPKRHPAALAMAIMNAWRFYRWRAYGAGVLAGVIVGGIAAPIGTTTLLIVLYLAGAAPSVEGLWQSVLWTLAFALTVAFTGATLYARWQPPRLRMAAEAYLWLAMRAEANWARDFGGKPVPRHQPGMRAVLAATPETPETAGERYGLWVGLLELDRARAAAAQMPDVTAYDRYNRATAAWLIDFVGGTTQSFEPLEALLTQIEKPEERLEATVELAVHRARAALADGNDWQTPLSGGRSWLGPDATKTCNRFLWRAAFRALLISGAIGMTVFWVAIYFLEPYVPVPVASPPPPQR